MSLSLMKTPAAAEYLGISAAFLEKARVYGRGPKFAKIGRAVAYRESDLDDWVASRIRESTSDPDGRSTRTAEAA